MITRPLDLASRLRREPYSTDWLFFVNGGLIVLFFLFFSSKFVLAPSLGVDFRLPELAGADAAAQPATHSVNVTDSGQIFADGLMTLEQWRVWLRVQRETMRATKHPSEPVLLVFAGRGVPVQLLSEIYSAADEAGFKVRLAVEEPKDPGPTGGRRR